MNEMDDRILAPRIRIMQIIAFALITGVVIFLGFACIQVFVQREGKPLGPPEGLPIITIAAIVMLFGGAIMSFVLPMVMTGAAMQRLSVGSVSKNPANDYNSLLSIKQTTLIVGMALLEGPAFMAGIAFLVEARQEALGLAGIAIVGLALKFPTQAKVRAWLCDSTNRLDQMRQETR
jgi:hypothetical protein